METLKEKRNNPLYLSSLLLHGNNKLLDYDNQETKTSYRYAQFNTRPIIDCPFRSAGCEQICYATTGNHRFPSVKNSREKSFQDSKRKDFSSAMIYTIETELTTNRYKNNVMIIRIHESGDFYSYQYLLKWFEVWKHFEHNESVVFCFYTKSFPFFLKLTDLLAAKINDMLSTGRLAISWSVDDTTTKEQIIAYLKCCARYPKANTYRCTETPETVEHDEICDCKNCAKCGTCVHTTGKKTVVKIHSASNTSMEKYRENSNGGRI